MPRKQKQKQRQSQKQVVNINLGKSSGKRKYTRRPPSRVQQAQPIYNFTPQPYQLTPQIFMTPQPKQELEIPTLGSQQPKKNTVEQIKMDIPEPPKPKLEQFTETPLSEYTKASPKPPTNIINQPPRYSGLNEAIVAQREKLEKVKSNPYYQNILEKVQPSKREPSPISERYDFGKEVEREKREREREMKRDEEITAIPAPFAPKRRGPNKSTIEKKQMKMEDVNVGRFY